MFCAADDFEREPAGEGEFCEGFNEFINGPYPDCEEGLECNLADGFFIGGAKSVCEQKLAGLGEVCEGFNEFTGKPFPSCEQGFDCKDAGLITIPGAGNVCKESSTELPKCRGGFFNSEICQCTSLAQCLLFCPPPLIGDPINNCACYTEDEYSEIYAHTKGPDCLPGTEDDFKVERENLDFKCEGGEFNFESCTCNSLIQCRKGCPPG